MSVCFYVRLAGPVLTNLINRLGTEMADGAVGMKQRILYPIRRLLSRYDDVLPPDEEITDQEKSLTPDGKTSNTPTLPRPSHAIQDQRQSVPRPLPPTPNASENIQRPTIKIPVVQMPWYFNVDRTRSKEILRNYDNGTFMIRPSTQTQNPLTLTLKYNERTFNIVVRLRPDGKYALGTEKLTEENFSSVEELVNHYMTSQLALYSNGRPAGNVTLTKPPRKDNAYV